MLDTPPPRVVPPLKMKVEHGVDVWDTDLDSLKKEIELAIGNKLRVTPKIEMVPPNSLPRDPAKKLQLLEKRYKESDQ